MILRCVFSCLSPTNLEHIRKPVFSPNLNLALCLIRLLADPKRNRSDRLYCNISIGCSVLPIFFISCCLDAQSTLSLLRNPSNRTIAERQSMYVRIFKEMTIDPFHLEERGKLAVTMDRTPWQLLIGTPRRRRAGGRPARWLLHPSRPYWI